MTEPAEKIAEIVEVPEGEFQTPMTLDLPKLLKGLGDPDLLVLNLGCGKDIRPDAVNVDYRPLPGVDVVHDLDQPWPWKDGSVAYVKASHVFEHVADPVLFMTEAWRVLTDAGGLLDIRVPYWQHVYAYTDPTHRRFCTHLTWEYWIPGSSLHEAFGEGMGSPPARFDYVLRDLNGPEKEELQVILRKVAG